MRAHNLQSIKLDIINRITSIEDKSIIEKVWDILSPTTAEKEQKATSKEKEAIIKNIKAAVKELNLIKEGKLKGIPAKDLLDEL